MQTGLLNTAFLLISIILVPSAAIAASITDYSAGQAANGIGKSRHNMGSLGRVLTTDATSEVCVFCHTPHHTNQGGGVAPLWNRSVENASSYTAYGTTIGGTNISDGDLGGATLACLSCHDGVTTFDNLVNRPGKDTASGKQNYNFFMPEFLPGVEVSSPLFDHFTTGFPCSMCHNELSGIGVIESMIIGPGLADDHPVSVTYDEGVASLRDPATDISTIDLSSGFGTTNDNLMQNRWAVKGFISDSGTIGDLLRNGKVECSSCHDPHFRNLSWDEAEDTWLEWAADNGVPGSPLWCGGDAENCSDGLFLRRVGGNAGSGVCRTCHNK